MHERVGGFVCVYVCVCVCVVVLLSIPVAWKAQLRFYLLLRECVSVGFAAFYYKRIVVVSDVSFST